MAVVVDIDGCIFDNSHRHHLIPGEPGHTPNWTEFNQACANDEPVLEVINLVKHLADAQGKQITFVTSRAESAKSETAQQLFTYFADYQVILKMRGMDDHRSTVDYKRDVFHQLSDNFTEQSIIIDDHPGIIEMVRKNFPQVGRLLVPSYDCTVIKGVL